MRVRASYAHICIVLIKSNKKCLLNKKINRVKELEAVFGFSQTNNMLASCDLNKSLMI